MALRNTFSSLKTQLVKSKKSATWSSNWTPSFSTYQVTLISRRLMKVSRKLLMLSRKSWKMLSNESMNSPRNSSMTRQSKSFTVFTCLSRKCRLSIQIPLSLIVFPAREIRWKTSLARCRQLSKKGDRKLILNSAKHFQIINL